MRAVKINRLLKWGYAEGQCDDRNARDRWLGRITRYVENASIDNGDEVDVIVKFDPQQVKGVNGISCRICVARRKRLQESRQGRGARDNNQGEMSRSKGDHLRVKLKSKGALLLRYKGERERLGMR